MKKTNFADPEALTLKDSKESHISESKTTFNYNNFWTYINEEYFKEITDKSFYQTEELIYKVSNNVFNLANQKQKKQNQIQKDKENFISFKIFSQNNNLFSFTSKNFKNYIQKDKNQISNMKNFKSINEEIDYLEDLNREFETFNKSNLNEIKEKCQKEIKQNKKPEKQKIEEIELKLHTLSQQIYILQMKQFAESISQILREKRNNNYIISFDPTENYHKVKINANEYNELISYRDNSLCGNLLEVFILNNNISNPKLLNNYSKNIEKNNKENNSKEKITIGHFLLPTYNFCHQCKLKKLNESLIKCQMCNDNIDYENKPKPKVNIFSVNNAFIIQKEKIYLLINYDGNIKELIDNYFSYQKKNTYSCNRFYCESCLKQNYEIVLDDYDKKKFICPCCNNHCTCSRCLRKEELMKLIAYYLTLGGKIDYLYNFLKSKNLIFEKLKDDILLSKFIIFNLSSSEKEEIILNKKIKVEDLIEFRNKFEIQQQNFAYFFEKIRKQRQYNLVDMELLNLKLNENEFVNKKRKGNILELDNDNDTISSSNDNNGQNKKRKNNKSFHYN